MNHLSRKADFFFVILALDRFKTVKVMSPGYKMGQQWGWGGGTKEYIEYILEKKTS